MKNQLLSLLESLGQHHLLQHAADLPPDGHLRLHADLHRLPLEHLPTWVEQACSPAAVALDPARLDPPQSQPPSAGLTYRAAGEALIRAGGLAALVVAGGQGTRLGHDGPKGELPATPISGTSLFGVFAGQLMAAQARFGVAIPWYVMTSPENDARTRAFFRENEYFGLDPRDVVLFSQGEMPTLDLAGRLLLAGPDRLATHPDGHGGALMALRRSGALDDLVKRGIQHLSYFQIDNPATRILDADFLGLHAYSPDSSGEMSSKVVVKTEPTERVGVFAHHAGRLEVIEYSDLPAHLAAHRQPDGQLAFRAGNVAVHLLGVEFLTRVAGEAQLPLHRARKVAAFYDPTTSRVVEPTAPNAVKLERFIFDALSEARRPLLYEVDRVEAFAPIKNADGVDSPASSRALQIERAARWLAAAGVAIPRRPDGTPDCMLEIRPATALSAEDLLGVALPSRVHPGDVLLV